MSNYNTDKNELDVSIIVPVYNASDYIRGCLDTLTSQTMDNYEIILVNDGSTDGSGEVCDEYARAYDCISVIHQDNKGVSEARNAGLDRASGKYVAFVDSDDYVIEHTLGTIVDLLGSDGLPDLVFMGWESVYPDGRKERANFIPDRKRLFGVSKRQALEYLSSAPRFPGLVWSKLFKREIISDNNLRFKVGMDAGEDVDFTLGFVLLSETFDVCDTIFYQYRARGLDSLTTINGAVKNAEAFLYIIEKYDEAARGEYGEYAVCIHLILANYYIALLANADEYAASAPERDAAWNRVKKWQWLLTPSAVHSRKAKFMARFKSVFGLRVTAFLSHLYVRFIR
jgi:glycosyltransferase involved in cell wall biosynthesis